ncbi:MAG: hypothetical protein K5644_03550 [Lachnospiraceae bacterium]|nr:hypothetical protein [Lachnospiraceae bacterium]
MGSITNIQNLSDGNQILGSFPNLKSSQINFKGKNNILYCESGITLTNSTINFKADNSVVYLGKPYGEYVFDMDLHNDTVFHIGKRCYTNDTVSIILSEQKHCYIGDDVFFSVRDHIRNADAHLIYSASDKKRLNPSKSVFIGDHVWFGQDCQIFKGTQIDSGSVIGASSLLSGKKVPHNTIWAGNPAKQLKDDIFWDPDCVHKWTTDMTKDSEDYNKFVKKHLEGFSVDNWIFTYEKTQSLSFDEIDRQLTALKTSQEKCDYLIQLENTKSKNRFVHNI